MKKYKYNKAFSLLMAAALGCSLPTGMSVTVCAAFFRQTRENGSEEVTVNYVRIDHNFRNGGGEKMSLNDGCEGAGLYLYYTEASRYETLYYDKECERPYAPIRNFAYGHGDNTPFDVGPESFAELYGGTNNGMEKNDAVTYQDMKWEYVMGIDYDSLDGEMIDLESAYPMGLNHGQLPGLNNKEKHHGDMRIMMYADHGGGAEKNDYRIKPKAVPESGDPAGELTEEQQTSGKRACGHLIQE